MNDISKSTLRALKELKNVTRALYELAPLVVVIGMIMLAGLIGVTFIIPSIKIWFIALMVFFLSLIIYMKMGNFGEASLALIAGLFAAISVEWTSVSFSIFIIPIAFFAFSALLIESVKLASQSESIYLEAAILYGSTTDSKNLSKELEGISKSIQDGSLGPIEKAECVRLFAFRKCPKNLIYSALTATSHLSTITGLDPKYVAQFIADLYLIFGLQDAVKAAELKEGIFSIMRKVPVSPKEFIEAFNKTKDFIIHYQVTSKRYLKSLESGLKRSLSGDRLMSYLNELNKFNQL